MSYLHQRAKRSMLWAPRRFRRFCQGKEEVPVTSLPSFEHLHHPKHHTVVLKGDWIWSVALQPKALDLRNFLDAAASSDTFNSKPGGEPATFFSLLVIETSEWKRRSTRLQKSLLLVLQPPYLPPQFHGCLNFSLGPSLLSCARVIIWKAFFSCEHLADVISTSSTIHFVSNCDSRSQSLPLPCLAPEDQSLRSRPSRFLGGLETCSGATCRGQQRYVKQQDILSFCVGLYWSGFWQLPRAYLQMKRVQKRSNRALNVYPELTNTVAHQ